MSTTVPPLAASFKFALRRTHTRPTKYVLWANVQRQRMVLYERGGACCGAVDGTHYHATHQYVISTSSYGTGQRVNSNQTPLGLHRIAEKIGGGFPVGAVFRSRKLIGYTWQGKPDASIVHRILWLEGLEDGLNRGGNVDTLKRYIYIHGYGDETTLGRPQSHGCIHLSSTDLMPLYDRLPKGTLVWISER